MLQSCLGPLPSSRPVCGNCEEPDRFVRLEKVGPDFLPDVHPPFSHPAELHSDQWTKILSSIYVQQLKPGFLLLGGKGNKEPAFTQEDIQYFSMTLPKAFEQAQPDEIVVYALIQSPHPRMSLISTGGFFFKNKDLYLILSNHRFAVSMPGIRELLWEHPLYSQAVTYELVQENHQTIVQANVGAFQTSPLMMKVAYRDLLMDGASPSRVESGRLPSAPSLQDGLKTPEPSIEKHLETLKHLRERGLITEEEYQRKKNELLDRF